MFGFLNTIFMNSVIHSLFESSNLIKKPEHLLPRKPNLLALREVDLPILLLLEPQSVLYCLFPASLLPVIQVTYRLLHWTDGA